MTSDLKPAIDTLVGLGLNRPNVVQVHDHGEEITKLIVYPDGTSDVRDYAKPVPGRVLRLRSLDSFLDYVKDRIEHDDANVEVQIGLGTVIADFAIGRHVLDVAVLDLIYATEYQALNGFANLNPKAAWNLLMTKLYGCFDPALAGYLQGVNVKKNLESSVQIQDTGVATGGNKSEILVSFTAGQGSDSRRIPVDWLFRGQVFEYFEQPYEIPCRLFLDAEGQLTVSMRPIGVEKVMRQVRKDLEALIRTDLPERARVYIGESSSED